MRLPRTRAELAESFDLGWRALTPAVLVLPMLALMALPIALPMQAWTPQLGLLAVMFWSTQKPDWMPPLAAMALGLLHDLWLGTPLGLMMLVYGAVALTLSAQLKFFLARPFGVRWAVLSAIIAGIELLLWCAASATVGVLVPVRGFAAQAGLTILLMPLMFYLLSHCLGRLLDRRPPDLV